MSDKIERPKDATLARMLRAGASGISMAHHEYCVSSDNCSCYEEEKEMLAAANLLDPSSPEESQRRSDEAIVAGVAGFPIFDSKEEADRYFDAAERLSAEEPPAP